MSPEEFISRWRGRELKERQFYQSHFNELCRVLDVPDPISFARDADYCFEKAVPHTDGAAGFADVWKRDSFVWEYKGETKNLTSALVQADRYARALANPPLLIVSDAQEIRVRTNFTNEITVIRTYRLHDLATEASRRELRDCWIAPDRLRPSLTREAVTAKAAGAVGDVAARLRARKDAPDPRRIAHVMNRFVFCLFAEDVGVLPDQLFSEILEDCLNDPPRFAQATRGLFRAMKDRDGLFGSTRVPWVNGGLFDDDDVLDLDGLSIRDLFEASKLDWSAIEPSIFGTLFERGLDPGRRRAMAGAFDGAATPATGAADRGPDRGVGIHYTDPDKIMKIVEPVVLRPLAAEWAEATARIAALRAKRDAAATDAARTRHEEAARALWWAFRERLGAFRVLDPACGSGNFLYMALVRLKDFDRRVQVEGRALDLPPDDERIGPHSVLGIEVNPYAAELARTTVWIGELQWQRENTGPIRRAPVLGRLDGIECRDALLNEDGTEAAWPRADAIVGNPPFLGTKRLIATLGEDYVARLRRAYDGRVPQEADLVAVWVARAAEGGAAGTVRTAGLVTTNSIRGGASRRVVARMLETATLYDAYADEEWAVEGAAVRVSLLCFARRGDPVTAAVALDGAPADEVFADLTGPKSSHTFDITKATPLKEGRGIAFQGPVKVGAFDIEGEDARKWLNSPLNPNSRSNREVLVPWLNGMDITRRSAGKWIIDFGDLSEEDAAFFEAPFSYVELKVKAGRLSLRDRQRRDKWWRLGRSGEDLKEAIGPFARIILTPRVSKHRLFRWIPMPVLPDSATVAIARDDDTTFGILHSRFHEAWSLRMGTSLEDRPRYTPTTCFETFPFPAGLTPDVPAAAYADDPRAVAIAAAARDLDEKREAWLNPPDLTMRVPEVVPGYPDRILPRNDRAAAILKKRTLTNLYNERPAWLDHLHRRLDAAVAAAYGWPADLPEADALARLFALNRERAAKTP
ncbi:MAG: class I SAM-dependent DNA methyltransferase [Rhodospirillales bacterium]